MGQGVTVVAAEGNQADDLTHPTADATSPDDMNPVLREIHNQCAVVPTEVPGVIGVTANGNKELKSFYSSYGIGTVEVVAPGGDTVLQLTPAAPNGRVLSTWPASLLTVTCLPARRLVDASGATYCYQQGTSMASPHVAGVAALIASPFGHMMPGAMRAMLTSTADPIACPPDPSIYDFFPAVHNGAPQVWAAGPTGWTISPARPCDRKSLPWTHSWSNLPTDGRSRSRSLGRRTDRLPCSSTGSERPASPRHGSSPRGLWRRPG